MGVAHIRFADGDWRKCGKREIGWSIVGGGIGILDDVVGVDTLRGEYGSGLESLMRRQVYQCKIPLLDTSWFEYDRSSNLS